MTDRDLQQKRIVAALVDIGVAIVIWVGFWMAAWAIGMAIDATTGAGMYIPRILGFLGSLVSLGYILGRDVLAGDRSIGKRIQGIRVVTAGGGPITFNESARRNGIFAIGAAMGLLSATLQLIPCLGDVVACLLLPLTILGALISVGAAIFEILKITQDPDGIRFGDQQAGTRVVR